MKNVYGYVRVSSREQNEDRQMITLREVKVPPGNIFADKESGKDIMGTFLSDIVLLVLSFVVENECTNIRKRQTEGISAAKARWVRFGRPPKSLLENFCQVYQQWKNEKTCGQL